MKIFELAVLVCGLAGGMIGAALGAHHGFGSAAMGGFFGAFAGIGAGLLLVATLGSLVIFIDVLRRRLLLRRHFGRYWRRGDLWRNVTETFTPGSLVRGEVVAKQPYGVFVDVGCGFPAFIARSDTTECASLAVGETVEARVLKHSTWTSELVLTQRGEAAPQIVVTARIRAASRRC